MALKKRSNKNQLQRVCRAWCKKGTRKGSGFESARAKCVRACKKVGLPAYKRLRQG